jgi:hypothetical protein
MVKIRLAGMDAGLLLKRFTAAATPDDPEPLAQARFSNNEGNNA